MITDAPETNAAYGSPHDMAWNIGTMTSSRVVGPRPNDSGRQTWSECR
ncbi:hypothetical protein GCM10010429_18420 [Micromonospora olivasterospora]